jgi:hypothetical protein
MLHKNVYSLLNCESVEHVKGKTAETKKNDNSDKVMAKCVENSKRNELSRRW